MTTHLLPSNATLLEQSLAEIDAGRITGIDADIIRRIHLPDECPEALLPYLAWERSVDEWDPNWDEAVKRTVIRVSFDVHRFKGTAFSMDQAISALGGGVEFQEWFEYGGGPYRFRLRVELGDDQHLSVPELEQLHRVALKTKNVRSYLDNITLARRVDVPFYVGMAIQSRLKMTVLPDGGADAPPILYLRPYSWIGVHVQTRTIATIKPGA